MCSEAGAEKKVKVEESLVEEELSVEMTSSDAAISYTTCCDVSSHGDDVVSSTSDVITCDYEGSYSFHSSS